MISDHADHIRHPGSCGALWRAAWPIRCLCLPKPATARPRYPRAGRGRSRAVRAGAGAVPGAGRCGDRERVVFASSCMYMYVIAFCNTFGLGSPTRLLPAVYSIESHISNCCLPRACFARNECEQVGVRRGNLIVRLVAATMRASGCLILASGAHDACNTLERLL